MLGAWILDDPFEESLNLPKGEYDVPLMVTDRTFDQNNQIPYTFSASRVLGDVVLVNGVPQPFHEVEARRYRFRLYNVSNKVPGEPGRDRNELARARRVEAVAAD